MHAFHEAIICMVLHTNVISSCKVAMSRRIHWTEEGGRTWLRWCHPTKQVRVCQYRSILSIVWWGEISLVARVIFEDEKSLWCIERRSDSRKESYLNTVSIDITVEEEISLDSNNERVIVAILLKIFSHELSHSSPRRNHKYTNLISWKWYWYFKWSVWLGSRMLGKSSSILFNRRLMHDRIIPRQQLNVSAFIIIDNLPHLFNGNAKDSC